MHYVYEGCCGRQETSRFCRLASYESDPTHHCPDCGRVLKQVITPPRVLANTRVFEPFVSPIDRTVISSETALREHNKRHNVVNIHDGYDEKAVQNFGKRNFREEINKESSKDLRKDTEIAINRVMEGYKPTIAHEDSPL